MEGERLKVKGRRVKKENTVKELYRGKKHTGKNEKEKMCVFMTSTSSLLKPSQAFNWQNCKNTISVNVNVVCIFWLSVLAL